MPNRHEVKTSPRIHSDSCGMAKSIRRPGGCRLVKDRRRRRQRVPPVKPHRGGIHDYCALQYSKRFYNLRPARWCSQHGTAGNRCIAAVAESHAGTVASPVTGPLSLWSGSAARPAEPQPRRSPRQDLRVGRVAALSPMAINIGTGNAGVDGPALLLCAGFGAQTRTAEAPRSAATVVFREDELARRAP
jgi:hypothetical protein